MRRGIPGGTVTFLFTQIADSVRRWNEDPSAMAEALSVHDAIVRNTMERHGGYVFDTRGDGMRAAFSTPAVAAAAAIDTQEHLRDDGTVDRAVRMALHTAEATEHDGTYSGNEVNRAARLLSLSHGGQVLVSDATEVLLRHRVTLRPLGENRLHGLRGRMSVYQLVADGLPADFPVLRSIDRFAGNLPQQLSSLVGREHLIDEVVKLMQSCRLVTLSGVGGVGKTRLALEVGEELAGEFPDGVWMVELASIDDPAAVPAAIAACSASRHRATHRLSSWWPSRSVVGACCWSSTTVNTSWPGREPRSRRCSPGQATPGCSPRRVRPSPSTRKRRLPWQPLALDGGVVSDAVTLFVDRARAVRPDFGLGEPGTAIAVTEICKTLDGLPLGIELAAARMAAMSAVEVRDRLADRFRLLQASQPGPERQITLR